MVHKNLIQEALCFTSDRFYQWRLLLDEYGPNKMHIKDIHNTVANAISRLDYGPVSNEKDNLMTLRYTPNKSTKHKQHPNLHEFGVGK